MSPTLTNLYRIFGQDTVFLPIPKGTKGPKIKQWQAVTLAESLSPEYQRHLELCVTRGGNIGVLLGTASGRLFSIDIDLDHLIDPYLALNPVLAGTTRTRGKRGCNFFLRLKPGVAYPNSKAAYDLRDCNGIVCGEWRCAGGGGAQTVVFGIHPDGPTYQIPVDASPVVLDSFDVLQWFYPFDTPPPNSAGTNSGTPPPPVQPRTQPQTASGTTPQNSQGTYGQALADLGEPFIRTDRGYSINQSFFARIFAVNRTALFDRASKDYYTYTATTGAFDRLSLEAVLEHVSTDIFAEAVTRRFPGIGAKISSSLLKSISELIKSDRIAAHNDFFARGPRDLPVIHAANSMFRLENDGSISQHDFSPNFRSRNPIAISYNPKAKARRFKKELLTPVLSLEDIETLQRYYGLILIGGNRAQKILMLLGEGGAGKGTIVLLGDLVIGRRNVGQLRVSELGGRFETYRCVGKLLLTVVEATYDCLTKEGAEMLKAMVGHDPMDAEKKYQSDPVQYEGIFPVIYVSNEDPTIRLHGDESAWSRRLVPLSFPNARPPGSVVIDRFEEVLFEAEAEGVFAWMIEGAKKHWKELRGKKGFATTADQKRRAQEIIARSKSILTFVLDGLRASGTRDLTADDLYDGYMTFCLNKKWRPFPDRKFSELVRPLIMEHFGIGQSHDIQRMNAKGKTTSLRGYRGIDLVP
jgi:hypothetical protein